MATPETIISEIHRVHRSMALYPKGYLKDSGYSIEAMKNIYDPEFNECGVGLLFFCGLMDDYDITHSPETNDDLHACDVGANSTLTGMSYEISGTSRRDKDLTAWSSNNALFAATMKEDTDWELLDFYGANDSEKVLPEDPFTNGVEWRLYEFSTDLYRDKIENGSMASSDLNLLPQGKIIQSRSVIGEEIDPNTGEPKRIKLSYVNPTEFNSNENVDLWIGLPGALSSYENPDINEVNDTDKFRNIVGVSFFDNTTYPSATASDTVGKAVINQNANVSKRGKANGQTTLAIPLPKDLRDVISTQGWIYNSIDVKPDEEIILPVVTRIAQAPTTTRSDLKAGDLVSVYAFKFRIAHRNSTGDDPYFIDSEGALAGQICVNTFAIDSLSAGKLEQVVKANCLPTVIGQYGSVRSTVNGINTTYAAKYSSSDLTVARVDSTGTVHAVGAGDYTITSSIAGCDDVTTAVITVSAPVQPSITTGEPVALDLAGGVIELEADDFIGVSAVSFDGDEATEWAVSSDKTKLKAVYPAYTGDVAVLPTTIDIQIAGHWGDTVIHLQGQYS